MRPRSRRLDAALETASELSALQPGNSGVEMHAAVAQARARSARGGVLSVMGRHGAALDELETARQLWAQSVKRVEQSATDLHEKVLLLLYRVGNLKMAEQHLNEAERISLPPRGDAWTCLRADAVRLDDARHESANAANRLRTSCPPETRRIPRVDVRVAVAALASDRGDDVRAYVALLDKAIDRISPPGCCSAGLLGGAPGLRAAHAARGARGGRSEAGPAARCHVRHGVGVEPVAVLVVATRPRTHGVRAWRA